MVNALLNSAFGWTNGLVGGLYNLVQYLIWFGAVAAIIWFILEERKNKYRARIFEKTHNGETFFVSRAKEKTIDLISHWRIKKKRLLAIAPTINARYLDSKGKLWADGDLTEQGEIQWRERSDTEPTKIPDDILKLKNSKDKEERKKYSDWLKENETENREIISSNDRGTLFYELAKIKSREKQGIMSILEKHGNVIVMAMLVVILIIFWGSIAQPALQSQETAANMVKEVGEITKSQADITNKLDVMISYTTQRIGGMNMTSSIFANNNNSNIVVTS